MDLELLTGHKMDPLTGNEIRPDELNDDMFARLLDRLFETGCDNLFFDIAIAVRTTFSLPANYVLHSDTTSHVLYGNYPKSDENSSLHITNGNSKDKHPELKQIMTGTITDGDGLLVYSMALDGNTADCTYNFQMISVLKTVFSSELKHLIYIADSKLINEKNVRALISGEFVIPFISHIPASFHDKLSETLRCTAYEQDAWEFLGSCCAYTPRIHTPVYYVTTLPVTLYGTDMYAHVYKTTEKRSKVEKRVLLEQEKLKKEVEKLCKEEFFCEADAVTAMNAFLQSHSKLMSEAELVVISEITLKKPRGRPGKNPKPAEEIVRWKMELVEIRRKEEEIEEEIRKKSTFSLLTPISPEEKSSREILLLYKGQNNVETQFSLLKEPVMAATIFLETPERIKALMMLIYVSVLMHGIIRVIAHIELEKEEEPPRWGYENRPLVRPTSHTILRILGTFSMVSNGKVIEIEAKEPRKAKELRKILEMVRFDPEFM
jgi:transposase